MDTGALVRLAILVSFFDGLQFHLTLPMTSAPAPIKA